ncbi:MAG: helix-turn-helix domain-containing protein [Magnetococcales bacterium]|nr:helix-turn-helix domain-containing protein [Magnetococcales bacterium]
MTSPLMTQIEASEYLRVDWKTLANWRARKIGPSYVKMGSLVYYTRADLDAYLKARTVDPKAKPDVVVKIKPRMADLLRETLNIPRVPRGRTRKCLL